MTLDQIVGILGQIAAWVTILLVFLTLREMEKQRKASQKPEIIIPKVPLYGYSCKLREIIIPTKWRNTKLKTDEADEVITDNFQKITLYNIGFGAAKSIKLKWSFDIQRTLKEIQDYCYQNSIPIVASIKNGLLTTEIEKSISMVNVDCCASQEHEYLMPASVTSHGLESYLPYSFISLLSILVCMMIHQVNKKSSSSKLNSLETPALKLKMNFEDIGGGKYNKEFDVKFNISIMHIPKEGNNISNIDIELVQGVFEFTEKSP